MSLRKTLGSLLVAAGVLGATALPTISTAAPPVDVVIRVAPPPMRTEVIPVPSRGYVWVRVIGTGEATVTSGRQECGCVSDADMRINHIAGSNAVTAGI